MLCAPTVLEGNAKRHMGQAANVAALCGCRRQLCATRRPLKAIEAVWGPAPGKMQSDGRGVFVLGRQFGNVFVGLQPTFGYEGDPMRLLFEQRLCANPCFCAILSLDAQHMGRGCIFAFRHAWRAGIHARQTSWFGRPRLARSADRRSAKYLSLRLQQPLRGVPWPSGVLVRSPSPI